MITFSKRIPQGQGLAAVLLKRASEVALDWDTRSKSRFDATDSLGRTLAVFLPRGQVLRGGDVLVGEDGSLVRVKAQPQPVLQVRHCREHGRPFDLTRAAYHLGNRHVSLELQSELLQLEPDPVLAQMLRAMHLIVNEAQAAFEPEGGAYAAPPTGHAHHGHGHGHDHDLGHAHGNDHDHDHDHDHGHGHGHGHDHGHDNEHRHADGHGHGHGHGH
jgi:urease accessory protein